MTNVSCFFDEFLGTAVLLICVLSFTDRANGPPPNGLVPLALFILILGIGSALGFQTGYAINPARDLGPRILTAMVGYGSQVFSFRKYVHSSQVVTRTRLADETSFNSQYWLWCPVLGPILGGLVGTFIYDALLFEGSESLLNRP